MANLCGLKHTRDCLRSSPRLSVGQGTAREKRIEDRLAAHRPEHIRLPIFGIRIIAGIGNVAFPGRSCRFEPMGFDPFLKCSVGVEG